MCILRIRNFNISTTGTGRGVPVHLVAVQCTLAGPGVVIGRHLAGGLALGGLRSEPVCEAGPRGRPVRGRECMWPASRAMYMSMWIGRGHMHIYACVFEGHHRGEKAGGLAPLGGCPSRTIPPPPAGRGLYIYAFKFACACRPGAGVLWSLGQGTHASSIRECPSWNPKSAAAGGGLVCSSRACAEGGLAPKMRKLAHLYTIKERSMGLRQIGQESTTDAHAPHTHMCPHGTST